MAAKGDDPAPLDLSVRRNNHNKGTNNPPNRSKNRPRRFPPVHLPPTMGAPRSTSFESYSHSQAHQADAQFFPRGLQPAPGQFFSPENVLNLDPQRKPPVPPTNDIWNRNRNNNYSNNQNYNHTANPGSININGNNGPLGFRLPWINPYDNYPYQSNLNNYSINPTCPGSQVPPPLFQFQQNATPTQVHSSAYNFGYGNSPYYEQPRPIYNCRQPGPAFNSQPTHSSYSSWAQNHSAYYREETQGHNGLARNAPEVISLVSTGSIKIDTDDGDVIFLGYSSSIKVESGNENENDGDERPHVLAPHASIEIHELSPEVSIPGPSTNFDKQPESQDTGPDAALKRKENVAVSTGSFNPYVSLRHHGGSRIPIEEAPVKEPAYRIGVIQFGLRKNADKYPPAILKEKVAEKSGGSQGNKGITKSGEADTESINIPSPLPVQGNKCPAVPVQKSHGAASRVQIQRPVELRQDGDASSHLSWPRKGRKKPINWLLMDPDTDKTEIDALMGELG